MHSTDAGASATLQQALPLLLISVVLAIPYHLRPENFIVDDGYFYLQIARNIVTGKGSTFNGWLPTNGYHPLWMLVCCGCALVTRNTEALIQVASTVQDVLLLISVGLLVRLSGRARLLSLALGCTLLWIMGEVLGIWRLLESYLAVALQLTVLLATVAASRRKRSELQNVGLGLLLGFTLLARLDLIFFVGTVLLWQLVTGTESWQLRIRTVALQAVTVCCVVVPYLWSNVRLFGHMVPVSGAIKSTFPHLHGVWRPTPDLYVVVAGVMVNLLLLRKRQLSALQQAAVLSAIASVLYLLYAFSFTAIWPWYLTTGTITTALAAVWIGEALLNRVSLSGRVQALIVAAVVVLLFVPALVRTRTNLSMTRALISHDLSLNHVVEEPRKHLARELTERLPRDARVFVFDTPGSLAYYSGLSITPADGLVCDYGYSADLLRDGFAAYARQHDIQYVVVPYLSEDQGYEWLETAGLRHGAEQAMTVFAPMKHWPAGTFSLSENDLLFKASTIQPGFERTIPEVGIWKLNGE